MNIWTLDTDENKLVCSNCKHKVDTKYDEYGDIIAPKICPGCHLHMEYERVALVVEWNLG